MRSLRNLYQNLKQFVPGYISPNSDFKIVIPEQRKSKVLCLIGDGPEAHIAAIIAKQKGVENVIIIGKRQDFHRSGDFRHFVFDDISEMISPLEVKPSAGYHIKDVERQLHALLKDLKIQFIQGKFIGFDNQSLKFKNDKGAISFLEADTVIDCTGTARAVLEHVNAEHPKNPIFHYTPVQNNPHTTYALIRVYNPSKGELPYHAFSEQNTNKFNSVSRALALEELRSLGWQSYAIPYCYCNSFHKNKSNFYTQVPDETTPEKAIKVLKVLLKLFRNNPDDRSEPELVLHKKSQSHPKKEMVSIFKTDSYQTTPNYYNRNGQIILHLGDATAPMIFVLGQSLRQGLQRTEAFFNAVKIADKEIQEINFKQYDSDIINNLKFHLALVEYFYMNENNRIESENKQASDLYKQAFQECRNPEDKVIIKSGLERLDPEYLHLDKYAVKLREILDNHFKNITDKKTKHILDPFTKQVTAITKDKIKKIENYLTKIENLKSHLSAKENKELTDNTHLLAGYWKKASDYFYSLHYYIPTIFFCKKAIDLYKKYLPSQYSVELLNLYSNLIIVYHKKHQYDQMLHYASLASQYGKYSTDCKIS